MVLSTILSDGSNETPLLTSVPSVRANRLKAAARKTPPDQRQPQLHLVPGYPRRAANEHTATPRRPLPITPEEDPKPIAVQETADFQENQGGQRQNGKHVLQHAHDFGQDHRQQHRHREHAKAQDKDRIGHRGDDLAPHLVLMFEQVRPDRP